MKIFILNLILSCSLSSILAQVSLPIELMAIKNDSINKKEFILRPYIEIGTFFPKNDFIKQNYLTQSMFMWDIGFQMNHPITSSFYPYIQYSQSNFNTIKSVDSLSITYNSFAMKQFSIGFILKILKTNRNSLIGDVCYTQSIIDESINKIHLPAYGFGIGIGMERRIMIKSKFYIKYIYNFQKTEKSIFRDFDFTRITVGFCL